MSARWLDDVAWQQAVVLEERGFRWGRIGSDFVAQWTDLVVVRTDVTGRVQMVLSNPDAPAALIEKTIKGEMAAFTRSLAGGLSLHASAVALSGRALLLTGASGTGKSTMASLLCESFQGELLADDVAGLATRGGKTWAEPAELCVWLWDGQGEKRPVPMRVAAEPAELVAIVLLGFGDGHGAELLRLRGASIVAGILDGLIRFDVAPEPRGRECNAVLDLAGGVPMWQLVRPRGSSPAEMAELLASLMQPKTTSDMSQGRSGA